MAWQWCKNHVLPMISEAGLSFNLIQTGDGGIRIDGGGLVGGGVEQSASPPGFPH